MNILEVCLKFLSRLVCVLAKKRERALVFPRSMHLKIDVVLLEQLVKIRELGHNADGANNGKGCHENLVGNTSHHIPTARRNFID